MVFDTFLTLSRSKTSRPTTHHRLVHFFKRNIKSNPSGTDGMRDSAQLLLYLCDTFHLCPYVLGPCLLQSVIIF